MSDKCVHTEHCCAEHGCKYGNGESCPVVNHQKQQSYPCEECDFRAERVAELLCDVPQSRTLLTLWDKAVGTSDYVKQEWRDLSDELERGRVALEAIKRFKE